MSSTVLKEVVPKDSRYIPFTQQRMCCVPAAISMIMHRQNIPLIPVEELGYHLGLVVSPEDKDLFYNARVSEKPPMVGYGTQIQESEYDPNKVFAKLSIPLAYRRIPPSEIVGKDDFVKKLDHVVDSDQDAILCLDWDIVCDRKRKNNCGHVVVFDRMVDGKIRIIDPEHNAPKWQTYSASKVFDAIKHHEKYSGGIWLFTGRGKQYGKN